MNKEYVESEIARYEAWIVWCHQMMKKTTKIDGENTKVNMFLQIQWAQKNLDWMRQQ